MSPPEVAKQSKAVVGTPRRTAAVVALSAAELTTFFGADGRKQLSELLPDACYYDPDRDDVDEWSAVLEAASPEIVITAWRTPPLPASGAGVARLGYVCHLVGSVRALVPRPLLASGLTVTNWGDIAGPLVAEHALLLILGGLRFVSQWQAFMTSPFTYEEKNSLSTRSLRGRKVSIHGFGRIARELIQLLRPFGVAIRAFSDGVPAEVYRDHGVVQADDLANLAAGADVFVCCEALTDGSRGSINRKVLSQLPVGAVFVNVGRGAVVDEAALAEVAIDRGLRLALDVYTEEPLPSDAALRGVPGALYSPHIGGPTLDWYPRCGSSAIANIRNYLSAQPMGDIIDLEIYDRST